MRSTARVAGASRRAVTRLQIEAGTAAWKFHDKTVRDVRAGHVQCDEIWSFAYAKRGNVPLIEGSPGWTGDVWTCTAIDAGTKLIISFAVTGPAQDLPAGAGPNAGPVKPNMSGPRVLGRAAPTSVDAAPSSRITFAPGQVPAATLRSRRLLSPD